MSLALHPVKNKRHFRLHTYEIAVAAAENPLTKLKTQVAQNTCQAYIYY
jgi:hypothetical protein